MPTDKRSFNLKISPEAHRLIDQLAEQLGTSKAGVFEIAIRRLAHEMLIASEVSQENWTRLRDIAANIQHTAPIDVHWLVSHLTAAWNRNAR